MVVEGVDAIGGVDGCAAGFTSLCTFLIPLQPLRGCVSHSVRLVLNVTWLLLTPPPQKKKVKL